MRSYSLLKTKEADLKGRMCCCHILKDSPRKPSEDAVQTSTCGLRCDICVLVCVLRIKVCFCPNVVRSVMVCVCCVRVHLLFCGFVVVAEVCH